MSKKDRDPWGGLTEQREFEKRANAFVDAVNEYGKKAPPSTTVTATNLTYDDIEKSEGGKLDILDGIAPPDSLDRLRVRFQREGDQADKDSARLNMVEVNVSTPSYKTTNRAVGDIDKLAKRNKGKKISQDIYNDEAEPEIGLEESVFARVVYRFK